MKVALHFAAALTSAALFAAPASAAITTYLGFDAGVSAPGANALSAAAAFDAAVPGANFIDFESPLLATATVSGGSITSSLVCQPSLCGGNTTSGGSNFLNLYGTSATFNFISPITSFGAFFGGTQAGDIRLVFDDGSAQSISIPANVGSGGFAFLGFTGAGPISSVTVYGSIDVISVDDVRFSSGSSAVPEPATWAMMIAGFGGVGAMIRRRRLTAVAA